MQLPTHVAQMQPHACGVSPAQAPRVTARLPTLTYSRSGEAGHDRKNALEQSCWLKLSAGERSEAQKVGKRQRARQRSGILKWRAFIYLISSARLNTSLEQHERLLVHTILVFGLADAPPAAPMKDPTLRNTIRKHGEGMQSRNNPEQRVQFYGKPRRQRSIIARTQSSKVRGHTGHAF